MEPHHASPKRRFSAAGFAYESQSLLGPERDADLVDGTNREPAARREAAPDHELLAEFDRLEQRRFGHETASRKQAV